VTSNGDAALAGLALVQPDAGDLGLGERRPAESRSKSARNLRKRPKSALTDAYHAVVRRRVRELERPGDVAGTRRMFG
jgi:hypothetical protein